MIEERSPRYTGYKRIMSLLLQTNVYIHNYAYSHIITNKSNYICECMVVVVV